MSKLILLDAIGKSFWVPKEETTRAYNVFHANGGNPVPPDAEFNSFMESVIALLPVMVAAVTGFAKVLSVETSIV